MRTFGLDWPENLECSKFPEAGGGEVCVAQNATGSGAATGGGASGGAFGAGPTAAGTTTFMQGGAGGSMDGRGGSKMIGAAKNGAGYGNTLSTGGVGVHRNIRFVCPVQLKTPPPMGYSLVVGGEVSGSQWN